MSLRSSNSFTRSHRLLLQLVFESAGYLYDEYDLDVPRDAHSWSIEEKAWFVQRAVNLLSYQGWMRKELMLIPSSKAADINSVVMSFARNFGWYEPRSVRDVRAQKLLKVKC